MTPRSVARGESGQVAVLVLGLALVCFAIAGLAVDGTRVFLARRTLQNAADAAATAGAGQLDRRGYYRSGGRSVDLDPEAARRTAARWLAARGVTSDAAIDSDATSVTVLLRDEVATSWLGLVGIREIPVAVVARSRPIAGSP